MSQSQYDQQFSDLQASIIAADFAYKKEELKLRSKLLFSKDDMDALREKIWVYSALFFVLGLFFSWALCKILY